MQQPLKAYIEEKQQIEQIKLTSPPAPWEQILDTSNPEFKEDLHMSIMFSQKEQIAGQLIV